MVKSTVKEPMSLLLLLFDILVTGIKTISSKVNGYFQMETTMKVVLRITNLMVEVNGISRMVMRYQVVTIN